MKKFFIFIIVSIIISLSLSSCDGNVVRDIKKVVGNDVKVCSVKTIHIKNDFYNYTEEYNYFLNKNKSFSEEQIEWKNIKDRYENLFKTHSSTKQKLKEDYDNVVKSYQECVDSVTFFYNKCKTLENNKVGNIYVAKLYNKNEYTDKLNNYNVYSIFSYNSDGTIHAIDTGENMKVILSVFPEAKNDFKKVMLDTITTLVDSF